MRLRRVQVRFYKSFNFDFERRANGGKQPEWELIEGVWYPFVRIPIDPQVTAVVGANESGKSHLLDAIECVMGERPVGRRDFCRFSQLYSVETRHRRKPDVGAEFLITTTAEVEAFTNLGLTVPIDDIVLSMRPGVGSPFIACNNQPPIELSATGMETVTSFLPNNPG